MAEASMATQKAAVIADENTISAEQELQQAELAFAALSSTGTNAEIAAAQPLLMMLERY